MGYLVVANGVHVIPKELAENPREDQQDPQVFPGELHATVSEKALSAKQFHRPAGKGCFLDPRHYRA